MWPQDICRKLSDSQMFLRLFLCIPIQNQNGHIKRHPLMRQNRWPSKANFTKAKGFQ